MSKIAIFGGRFDPPHWGHYWVASQLVDSNLGIQKVRFMPTNIHPWRESFASASDRFKMCQILTEQSDVKLCVSDLEIKKGGISFTLDTVKQLKQDRQNEYFWVVGSDALPTFAKWEKAKELTRLMQFIVFPRADYPVKNVPEGFLTVKKNNNLIVTNYSSTAIRKRIREGFAITGLVPDKIEDYIYKHKLYR